MARSATITIQEIAANVRASAANIWLRCPAAPAEQAGEPNVGNDATAEGSAGHKAMELLRNGEDPSPAALAVEFGVSERVAEELVDAARQANASVAHPDWEQILEGAFKLELGDDLPPITGHIDRLAISPDVRGLRIDDYKFGWAQYPAPEDNFQMWLYALQVAEAYPDAERVTVQIRYPRQRTESEPHAFDRETLGAIRQPVIEGARRCYKPDPPYRTGPHCKWCAANLRCAANTRPLIADLVPANGADVPAVREPRSLMAMTPEEAGQALDLGKRMEAFAKAIVEQAKTRVDKLGAIPMPDGTRWGKTEGTESSVSLEAPGALDILIETCGVKNVLKGLSISKSKATNAARAGHLERTGKSRYGKGEPAQVNGALFSRLRKVGALIEKPKSKYETQKD